MNILAMCITWNRPQLLGRSIHCFLQQTDPSARMFILDDAGQYNSQEHERWTLVSVVKRYPTMGEKRNALLDMALKHYPQLEGFMLWDDDDAHFPHTIEYVSKALDTKSWAQPRLALEMTEDGQSLKQVETFSRKNYRCANCREYLSREDLNTQGLHKNCRKIPRKIPDVKNTTICYGGCWAWRLGTFDKLGRFPTTNHGEDVCVSRPCLQRFGPSADSSLGKPWYYYNRWAHNIAEEGRNFYALRGAQEIEPVKEIPIGWNGPNIFELPIQPKIYPRPW